MSPWSNDPRLPYAIAAILGMIAGIAAKQAVAIQAGQLPRPVMLLADILILGMIWLIVMFVHASYKGIPLEGIALLAAALAMWGPQGISLLLRRFQKGALGAAEQLAKTYLDSVEPVHRPTVIEAAEKEKEEAMEPGVERENKYALKSPSRKLRDIIPLKTHIPRDMVDKLGEADRVDPNYTDPTKGNGKGNGNGRG